MGFCCSKQRISDSNEVFSIKIPFNNEAKVFVWFLLEQNSLTPFFDFPTWYLHDLDIAVYNHIGMHYCIFPS